MEFEIAFIRSKLPEDFFGHIINEQYYKVSLDNVRKILNSKMEHSRKIYIMNFILWESYTSTIIPESDPELLNWVLSNIPVNLYVFEYMFWQTLQKNFECAKILRERAFDADYKFSHLSGLNILKHSPEEISWLYGNVSEDLRGIIIYQLIKNNFADHLIQIFRDHNLTMQFLECNFPRMMKKYEIIHGFGNSMDFAERNYPKMVKIYNCIAKIKGVIN